MENQSNPVSAPQVTCSYEEGKAKRHAANMQHLLESGMSPEDAEYATSFDELRLDEFKAFKQGDRQRDEIFTILDRALFGLSKAVMGETHILHEEANSDIGTLGTMMVDCAQISDMAFQFKDGVIEQIRKAEPVDEYISISRADAWALTILLGNAASMINAMRMTINQINAGACTDNLIEHIKRAVEGLTGDQPSPDKLN